jgi:hypothetical protein
VICCSCVTGHSDVIEGFRLPLHPQELPFNFLIRPFPGYPLGYLHPHAIIPHVTSADPRHPREPSAVRSLTDSNGHLYPFCFQYSCRLSLPSLLNGKPPIPFPFTPLRTLSVPTDGYTPLPRFYFPFCCPECALRAHKLRSFAQQALCLPHLRISWGEGGSMKPVRRRVHPLLQRLALDQQLRDQLCAAH